MRGTVERLTHKSRVGLCLFLSERLNLSTSLSNSEYLLYTMHDFYYHEF